MVPTSVEPLVPAPWKVGVVVGKRSRTAPFLTFVKMMIHLIEGDDLAMTIFQKVQLGGETGGISPGLVLCKAKLEEQLLCVIKPLIDAAVGGPHRPQVLDFNAA